MLHGGIKVEAFFIAKIVNYLMIESQFLFGEEGRSQICFITHVLFLSF
jgi:hypothetical protein